MLLFPQYVFSCWSTVKCEQTRFNCLIYGNNLNLCLYNCTKPWPLLGRPLAFQERNFSFIPVVFLIGKIIKFWWKQSQVDNNLIACILVFLWDTQVQISIVTSTWNFEENWTLQSQNDLNLSFLHCWTASPVSSHCFGRTRVLAWEFQLNTLRNAPLVHYTSLAYTQEWDRPWDTQ